MARTRGTERIETGQLSLTAIPPGPALAAYVRAFEVFAASDLGPEPICGWHFAEATVDLAISFGGIAMPGRGADLRRFALLGAKRRADPVVFSRHVDAINVRFHADGAAAFFGASMPDLTGRVVPLDDVWSRSEWNRVCELEPLGLAQRIAGIERLLLARLDQRRAPRRPPRAALRLLHRSGGRIGVEALAEAVDLSVSQLERLFRAQIGVGPKLLARQLRAYAAVQDVVSGRAESWAGLAARHGYADQPHLVREFRDLVGPTPVHFDQLSSYRTRISFKTIGAADL